MDPFLDVKLVQRMEELDRTFTGLKACISDEISE
jgi:hypothetical protein